MCLRQPRNLIFPLETAVLLTEKLRPKNLLLKISAHSLFLTMEVFDQMVAANNSLLPAVHARQGMTQTLC